VLRTVACLSTRCLPLVTGVLNQEKSLRRRSFWYVHGVSSAWRVACIFQTVSVLIYAGVTIGIVLIPQGLAYATLAGLPLFTEFIRVYLQ